jgi:lambda family phage portal protein
MDLDALRARARDLSINNDYARKFLAMVTANVVGPAGFTFQSRAAKPDGQPDKADQDAIEAAFAVWAQAGECDVTGRHAFADVCRTVMRAVARDGEALVRCVRDRRFAYGYRLQLLDIDRLDARYNETLKNGNRVSMSVEIDGFGRPAAYWLLKTHPGETLQTGETQARERVPAADIFHLFVADRPEQARGLPWMHTAMLRLQMLKGYEEAAIVAARTGAAKMGFFVSPDGTATGVADEKDEAGDFITDAEAGAFQVIPEGYDFKPWSPEYPTQNYDSFVKATLRGLASGLNVAYNSLANDLEGVNFSSIRSGTLEERDQWMVLQGWLVETFLRPLFLDWIETALLKGAITGPAGQPLPAGKLDKFKAHAWQGRRWSWVDPLKDIEASVKAIENGLASPYTIAAQQGLDAEDVLDDIARFQAAVAKKNVTLGPVAKPPEPAPPPAPPEPDPALSKLAAIAVMRMAEPPAVSPAPTFHFRAGDVHVAPAAVTVDPAQVHVAPAEVRVDVAPPAVTVEPAAVEVRIEAVMPEQAAPVVEVNVEMPEELRITSLPARRTTTEIERNGAGEITNSTQVEKDA